MGIDELNDELVTSTNEVELIDDIISEKVREIERRRETLIALALKRGYDGVDVITPTTTAMYGSEPMEMFWMGFEWEAWNEEAPQRDPYGPAFLRYDFRELTQSEREEILEHAGFAED